MRHPAAPPGRRRSSRRRPFAGRAPILLGALCGLAWAAALRAFMSEVAGAQTDADWLGTFGWILAPGLVAGALLGWAEHLRRLGGRRGWRWLALSPLLFAGVLVVGLTDPASLGADAVGGGAIGVPVLGMLGGFALSGRGPRWGRLVCGALSLSAIPVWALVAADVAGPDLGPDTPRGAWAALLYYALLAVLALGCAIPHRPVAAPGRGLDPPGRGLDPPGRGLGVPSAAGVPGRADGEPHPPLGRPAPA